MSERAGAVAFCVLVASVGGPDAVAAQEFFEADGSLLVSYCTEHQVTVPQRPGPRVVRFSISAPPRSHLSLTLGREVSDWGRNELGTTNGTNGFLEVESRLPRGEATPLVVWVCLSDAGSRPPPVPYTLYGYLVGRVPEAIPHAGDRTRYDDQLYRHLIFGEYDDPEKESRVLPFPSPKVYVHLGGPRGCGKRRVPATVAHYWRAVVPIIAEQLTGLPYPYRVDVGCRPREAHWAWIMVKYVTPAEYFEETGRDWGNANAKASVGAGLGKIWIRYDGRPAELGTFEEELIAHEIGHAFGLHHTNRRGTIMRPGDFNLRDTFQLFTPAEEAAARRAYRAGRGARYCGNPDRCRNGFPPGSAPPNLHGLPVRIAVD